VYQLVAEPPKLLFFGEKFLTLQISKVIEGVIEWVIFGQLTTIVLSVSLTLRH
jgi:hypothetical protein